MIYVEEYDCSENSQGIEFIGVTTFDNEHEAFVYADEQKKADIYCNIYDEAYLLGSTFPTNIPKEITKQEIIEMGKFLEGWKALFFSSNNFAKIAKIKL